MIRIPAAAGTSLAVLLAATTVAAQAVPTAPPYFPGQQIELLLVQTTEDVRDDPPRKTYRTPVTLRVVRKSTSETELEWRAGHSAGSVSTGANPILEMAERIFENLRLVVRLDAAGKYQGIQNESELREKIREFVLLLVPQSTARIADPEQRRRAADMMARVLTPEALLSAARKEIDLYFGLAGLKLEAGQPVRIPSSLLNPFGERGMMESEMELVPLEADAARGEATVEFRQEFAPGAAAAGAGLTLTDSGEYVLELSSGRVKRLRHVRVIRQHGEAVRVETTEITTR